MPYPALTRVLERLNDRVAASASGDRVAARYTVPGLWLDPYGPVAAQPVVPEILFHDRIQAILEGHRQDCITGGEGPGDWGQNAIAYNLFVRASAAWDHNGDGRISLDPNADGWRETGTFLKAITLLPFVRSLGCNTVHLLPITAVGRDGHKGDLGSPFAIRDPYALDETLSEPALGLGPEVEFAAFVEAAHHLGLRIVVEFVFRTAARDSVWAGEHPEWFYWIRADVPDRQPGDFSEDVFGAPLFSREELDRIYEQVGSGEHLDLLAPHAVYRHMYLPPPDPAEVRFVDGRWLGVTSDPESGAKVQVRVPGAFCDWTPDSDQPPWTDVTYLRLYDHPDFNYIAYNTVRIYDRRLAQPENAVWPLWERITEVIPHYQQIYGVDGAMIDMGHALPPALKQRLVTRAREADPDFALWAEDFDLRQSSRAEGYNACLGPFMQTVRSPENLTRWLEHLQRTGVPVPFMATVENHNTPRAATWPGGRTYSAYAMTIGALLPGIPYVHGGLELAETGPINTGFDFTQEQLAALPADMLPLFSAAAYAWTQEPNLVSELREIMALRSSYSNLLTQPGADTIWAMSTDNPRVVAFVRGKPGGPRLLAVCNSDMSNQQAVTIVLPGERIWTVGLQTTEQTESIEGRLAVVLHPGQVSIYELGSQSATGSGQQDELAAPRAQHQSEGRGR